MSYLLGWTYRTKIVITENSGNTFFDFQVGEMILQGNDSELPNYINFSMFKPDGSDLRITNSNGITQQSYWLRDWDDVLKTAKLYFKANVLISFSNNIFYLYGGNPLVSSNSSYKNTMTKVRNDISGQIGIYHFDEGPGGQVIDSSINGFNSYLNDLEYGPDGGGFKGDESFNFDGYSAKFNTGTPTIEQAIIAHDNRWNDLVTAGTIGFLVKFTSDNVKQSIIYKGTGVNETFSVFEISRLFTGKLSVIWGDFAVTYTSITTLSTILLNNWYDVVVTWSGLNIFIYINSVLDISGTMAFGMVQKICDIRIGQNIANKPIKNGFLEELFILDRLIGQDEVDSLYERKTHATVKPTIVFDDFIDFSVDSYDYSIDIEQQVLYELEDYSYNIDFSPDNYNLYEDISGDYSLSINYDKAKDIEDFNINIGYSQYYDYNIDQYDIGINFYFSESYDLEDNNEFSLSIDYEPYLSNQYEQIDDFLLNIDYPKFYEQWDLDVNEYPIGVDLDLIIFSPTESDIIIQVNSKFANNFTISSKFSDLLELNSKITNSFNVKSEII